MRDMARVGCAPRGWFQWHAAWHAAAAAALWLLYAFFRSERPTAAQELCREENHAGTQPRGA